MIKVKFKGNRIIVKCTSIADLQSGKREEGALDNEQHQLSAAYPSQTEYGKE